MPGLEKPMQIKQKADGWIVMDEKGTHHYASKEEAEAWLGSKKDDKDMPKPEDKDLFAADA